MRTSFAIVHHANQYLITTGYDNREGIEAIVGSEASETGFRYILRLHERLGIPLNLHLSGTLLEALAWHDPKFVKYVRELVASGLVELVGSCYGQNIMRFFGAEYNRNQLNEELMLFALHLGVDARDVKTFWPPERVWDTRRMAPALRDARLRNGGYEYVILDDRLLLARDGGRALYDETNDWDAELYSMHEIAEGVGLIALPIATRLRRSIPPRKEEDWKQVREELEGLLVHATGRDEGALLALYADDMEKVAGVGEWGGDGPRYYREFLEWLHASDWIHPIRLTEYAGRSDVFSKRAVELGTFQELATDFDAGEGYERWYLAPDWAPYRGYFNWAENQLKERAADGADPALLELACKQLLVANWETAWHTPSVGPHGDPTQHGHASPWAKALTSHSRHAAATAEAAHWMCHKEEGAHASLIDIDNDGEQEWVIRNQNLLAVIAPAYGGRLVALYSVSGECGAMVVGNPCDDWNWMEDLNRFMDTPRNHPGAFADVGFEHESYEGELIEAGPEKVRLRLTLSSAPLKTRPSEEVEQAVSPAFGISKSRPAKPPAPLAETSSSLLAARRAMETSSASGIRGLVKEYELTGGGDSLAVRYRFPEGSSTLSVDCGLSPDYLNLLRKGVSELKPIRSSKMRGWKTPRVSVWLKPGRGFVWDELEPARFGHGYILRMHCAARECTAELGVTARLASRKPRSARSKALSLAGAW